jgi:hypothetical protein
MMDPEIQGKMQTIEMESPTIFEIPKDLTKEKTSEVFIKSREESYDYMTTKMMDQVKSEPGITQLMHEMLTNDILLKNHGYEEDNFKSAFTKYNLIQDPKISAFMNKQFEDIIKIQRELMA